MLSSKELSSANIIHVGIRDLSLASNKNYISFSRPASSVSELVADLIKESGLKIDEDIATNLLMGVEEASEGFTGSLVSAETFATISELMKVGGKRLAAQGMASKENFPAGAIPASLPKAGQLAENLPRSNVSTLDSQLYGSDKKTQQEKSVDDENAPNDWLKPKIFKGTSVS